MKVVFTLDEIVAIAHQELVKSGKLEKAPEGKSYYYGWKMIPKTWGLFDSCPTTGEIVEVEFELKPNKKRDAK
jgi:hypothetical protein